MRKPCFTRISVRPGSPSKARCPAAGASPATGWPTRFSAPQMALDFPPANPVAYPPQEGLRASLDRLQSRVSLRAVGRWQVIAESTPDPGEGRAEIYSELLAVVWHVRYNTRTRRGSQKRLNADSRGSLKTKSRVSHPQARVEKRELVRPPCGRDEAHLKCRTALNEQGRDDITAKPAKPEFSSALSAGQQPIQYI